MIRGRIIQVIEGVIKRFSAAGRSNETFENREYFQHYGYTSRPKPGAELIIIREGNQIVAVASDDRRYRISLEEGEVAIYTDEGDKIHLKRGRQIEVIGGELVAISTKVATVDASVSCTVTSPEVTAVASSRVLLDTPVTHCTGDLAVDGGITCSGTYGTSGGRISTPGDIDSTGGEVSDQLRSMADDRDIYNGHTHPGDSGGTTGVPNQQE